MKISVIVATYNRCASLKKTLTDLCQQQMNGLDWEIIVIDNKSTDDTKDIVHSIKESFHGQIKYYYESQQGKPFALNHGIKESSGDIIAFTDDDVEIDPQWISSLVRCFEDYHCDGVGGRVLPIYPERTPAWIRNHPRQAAGTVVIYDYGKGIKEFKKNEMDHFIGANYAFKRSVFKSCGAFRTDLTFGRVALGEDLEFIERTLKSGKKLFYCGDALVKHPVDLKRASLKRMAIWHIALGKYFARMQMETNSKSIVYCAGIPCYILKSLLQDFFLSIVNLFNQLAFLKHYRSFFCHLGMIKEYRTNNRA